MSYMGDYNLSADVGSPDVGGALQSSAMTGLMTGGNPYMMAGSFLVNYLQSRAEQAQKKRELQSQIAGKTGDDQMKAMDTLNNSWKSALLG